MLKIPVWSLAVPPNTGSLWRRPTFFPSTGRSSLGLHGAVGGGRPVAGSLWSGLPGLDTFSLGSASSTWTAQKCRLKPATSPLTQPKSTVTERCSGGISWGPVWFTVAGVTVLWHLHEILVRGTRAGGCWGPRSMTGAWVLLAALCFSITKMSMKHCTLSKWSTQIWIRHISVRRNAPPRPEAQLQTKHFWKGDDTQKGTGQGWSHLYKSSLACPKRAPRSYPDGVPEKEERFPPCQYQLIIWVHTRKSKKGKSNPLCI